MAITAGLASCAAGPATTSDRANEPATVPSPTSDTAGAVTPEADCTELARYEIFKVDDGDWSWKITGAPVDTGSAVGATGSPTPDLTTYTVASGDTPDQIADRFCIDAVHLRVINKRPWSDGTAEGLIFADETLLLYPVGNASEFVTDPTP